MNKKITLEEFKAATNFVNNCNIMFPEHDLLDDQTRTDLIRCYRVMYLFRKQMSVSTVKKQVKPKKMGKLALYQEDVKECLRQGYGEEKQLLEEAYARKNPYARKSYINAYYKALADFQRE